MENKALLNQANDMLAELIHSVPEGQWEAAVPSTPKWTVKQLVNHLAATNQRFQSMIDGSEPNYVAIDSPTPLENWQQTIEAFTVALTNFTDYQKLVVGPAGETTASELFGLIVGDRLAHYWDLSTALGFDNTMPAVLVDPTYARWNVVAPAIERGDTFGPMVDVSEDSSNQDKFLALTGRNPHLVKGQ